MTQREGSLTARPGRRLSAARPRYYHEEDRAAVATALERGRLSVVIGRETVKFEQDFARAMGAQHAVATSSGTNALELALHLGGIGFGDEVIVPAYTFAASALAVVRSLAMPRFVDIDPDRWNASATAIRARITPRTRAVLSVHNFGNPAEMTAIGELCAERNLYLVEDCAQAAGAKIDGSYVGACSDAGCFSFNEIKNVTTGEGGMVLLHDAERARRGRLLRLYAAEGGVAVDVGMKCTMTEMEAALGRTQLRRLAADNARRAELARALADELLELPGITPQALTPGGEHAYSRFVFRVDAAQAGIDRDALSEKLLREHGFEIAPIYSTPLYRQPAFTALAEGRPEPGFAHSYHTIYKDDEALAELRELEMPAADALAAENLGFVLTGETDPAEIGELGAAIASIVEESA